MGASPTELFTNYTHHKNSTICCEKIIEFRDKKIAVKIFNPYTSSVQGRGVDCYATEPPSFVAIIFKLALVYASLLNSLNSVNSVTLSVKVEKLCLSCGIKNKPLVDLRGRMAPKFFRFHAVFGKIW